MILNRINSDMTKMRQMMQAQGEGASDQVQEGFAGVKKELSAHREHVSGTQDQIWAYTQFLEEKIDLLGVKLSEIRTQMAQPEPRPIPAAPQVHSVVLHAP